MPRMRLLQRIRQRLRERAEERITDAALDHLEDNPNATRGELEAAVRSRLAGSSLWMIIAPILIQVLRRVLEEWLSAQAAAASGAIPELLLGDPDLELQGMGASEPVPAVPAEAEPQPV